MTEPMTAEQYAQAKVIAGWPDYPDDDALFSAKQMRSALEWIERAVAVMRHMNDCIEGEWGSRVLEADELGAGFPEDLRLDMGGPDRPVTWPWERKP